MTLENILQQQKHEIGEHRVVIGRRFVPFISTNAAEEYPLPFATNGSGSFTKYEAVLEIRPTNDLL
jgi:hypothetical protein